jgi:hypothetical protein
MGESAGKTFPLGEGMGQEGLNRATEKKGKIFRLKPIVIIACFGYFLRKVVGFAELFLWTGPLAEEFPLWGICNCATVGAVG